MPEPLRRPNDLASAHCLVVGGSSGIGLEVARRAALRGAAVTIGAREPRRGLMAAESIGGQFLQVDATSFVEVSQFVDEAVERSGPPTMLVAIGGAGTTESQRLGTTPLDNLGDAWRDYFATRINAVAAVAPHMTASGYGKIVCVSTEAGRVPGKTQWLVGSVAAALFFAVRCLSAELSSAGVRINAVSITLVKDTPTYDRLLARGDGSPVVDILRRIEAKAPLGLPDIGQVADAVEYLLSPVSDGITGQVISVNGGVTNHG